MASKLHFILFPLFAQGHIIQMLDLAKLLAQRGMVVTIVSTPLNALRFKDMISRATELGLDMRVKELQIGCAEAGLPEGCENFDMLPTPGLAPNMFTAISNLQPQLEEWLLFGDVISPKPSCIITDFLVNCTIDVARKLDIPRIILHIVGCITLVGILNVHMSKHIMEAERDASKDLELRELRVLNHRFQFTKDQLSIFVQTYSDDPNNIFGRAHLSEKEAYGIILNTFEEEFEADYIREYKLKKPNKVYAVGPLQLCNKGPLDMAQRGNKTSIEVQNQCMEWLDAQEPGSVIYTCLGSLHVLEPSQMMELALGLEISNEPFILVMRANDVSSDEMKKMIIGNGLVERVKGRGLLIWGWAPQLSILSHLSTGAFLTHCGWNSTLEGATAGLPLVTWPLHADHFFHEKLLVQVLEIGVPVAPEVSVSRRVSKEDVKNAINSVMDKGEVGEKRRQKARKLGEIAKRCMDVGGVSQLNITNLIEDVAQYGKAK